MCTVCCGDTFVHTPQDFYFNMSYMYIVSLPCTSACDMVKPSHRHGLQGTCSRVVAVVLLVAACIGCGGVLTCSTGGGEGGGGGAAVC